MLESPADASGGRLPGAATGIALSYAFLKLLHVLSMAAWLGAALWVPGDVRRTLARGAPHLEPLAERGGAAIRLDLYAGIATVVTGLALFWRRAFLARPALSVGMALGIVLLLLVGFGVVPAWRRVADRLRAGDASGATAAAPRLAAFTGVGHLLWLVALALMVLPL